MESRKKVSQYKNPILNDMDYLSNISAFQCLWESCKDHLDEVAITYRADINVEDKNKKVPVNVITYRKLIKNILKTYNSLKNLGVKEGDVISYSSITTPEFIYVMYASILIGAIFDPVDPRNTEEELLKHFENEPSKLYFAPEKMFGATRNIYKDLKYNNDIIYGIFTGSCKNRVKSFR